MKSSETPKSPKKTTKKVADDTKEVKTKAKTTSTSSTKKTTTKKVKNKDEVVEETAPVKKTATKKTTTKKTTKKAETPKEETVKEPKKTTTKKTTTKKVSTKKKEAEPAIAVTEDVLPPIIISAPNPTVAEKVDTVSATVKPKETVVVHAVTPEKGVDDLLDLVHTDKNKADLAFKDVANTCSLIYDGYNVSNNGKIIASFRKCIAHTESTDFFNAIGFALHNRFQQFPQEMFNKVIDILDVSPSRFNVII